MLRSIHSSSSFGMGWLIKATHFLLNSKHAVGNQTLATTIEWHRNKLQHSGYQDKSYDVLP